MDELKFYIHNYDMCTPQIISFILQKSDFNTVCEQYVYNKLANFYKSHLNKKYSCDICLNCNEFNDIIRQLTDKLKNLLLINYHDIEKFDNFHIKKYIELKSDNFYAYLVEIENRTS